MADSYYSFWLVPQEPDLEEVQGIIDALSKRFGTVPFCPHVTLYSGLVPPTLNIQAVLAELASMQVFELEIFGIGHSSRFAKTLYVQLQPASALTQVVHRLVTAIPNAQIPVLDPHVSLLYHHLDDGTKEDLSRTISLSRSTIQFDQVQAVAAPQTFDTQEHVSSLRCVCRQFLSTP
ncbi:MAG: 2'-5' RNA ligase family protein [Synechococcales cyanobacterium T60_A2020_003]|nr:2'-5' RNA ligase family protein [Synechococcales cyanobacterium T60_A2020_003]